MRALRCVLVCAAILCGSSAHAQQDTTRVVDPPLLPAVFGGVIGSAAGAVGGGLLAYTIAGCKYSDDFCEVGSATLGGGLGSAIGAATGATVAARLGGGSPSFGRTLLVSMGGILVGAGAALLVSGVDDDGSGVVMAYTMSQGTLAGLGAALWRRKEE